MTSNQQHACIGRAIFIQITGKVSVERDCILLRIPINCNLTSYIAPTYMVSVEDSENDGGGKELQEAIWDAAKKGIEEWTGMEQVASSVYGIRVYTDGAILNPHVDRIPLVSSAIFNVAQDLDEDWPLEVFDRDGNAVNVTMEPGE